MGLEGLCERDLARVWHPCMQMKDFESLPLISIVKAKGVYLEDDGQNRYIDAISSWWVNLFGHGNEYIDAKIVEQLKNFAHVMTANFTHEPMVRLSERLCAKTNYDLSRCFYADNGSSAVEAALKMAYQFHSNNGVIRNEFICFEGGYHGETLGALSVGSVGLYRDTFADLLLSPTVCEAPADQSLDSCKAAVLKLEELLKQKGESFCAMIIEPLVQCAAGMRMYDASFLTQLRRLCDAYGILLIFDEIAVGFGRTGTFFAHERSGIRPDIMCLSKGITGGYLPLSVVMTSEKIYEAFYDDYASGKAFLHSHSYSGNALGCAAANAVLDIFDNGDVLEQNAVKSAFMRDILEGLKSDPRVLDVRLCGMIAAVELKPQDTHDRLSLHIFKRALKMGVFLRPLGNVIYIMPPYIIEKSEIEVIINALKVCIYEL